MKEFYRCSSNLKDPNIIGISLRAQIKTSSTSRSITFLHSQNEPEKTLNLSKKESWSNNQRYIGKPFLAKDNYSDVYFQKQERWKTNICFIWDFKYRSKDLISLRIIYINIFGEGSSLKHVAREYFFMIINH